MSSEVTKLETASIQSIISGLLTLATSEGGQALLLKFFGDAKITPSKVHDLVATLPNIKPPKEASHG